MDVPTYNPNGKGRPRTMLDSIGASSTPPSSPTVFIVDDDPSICRLLLAELQYAGCRAKAFASAADFLDVLGADPQGCLLLDLEMPDISGTELQTRLAKLGVAIPIIFLSGTADVPTTTTVMKRGAFDLIQKAPWEPAVLLKAVRAALAHDAAARREREKIAEIRSKIAELTPREHEVACLLVKGYSNKQIAQAMDLSERTVEIHRSRVMSKMQTESLATFVLQWTVATDRQL